MNKVTNKIKKRISKKKMSLNNYNTKFTGALEDQKTVTGETVKKATNATVNQQGSSKIKATYYLGQKEHQMLMNLFINGLKKNEKIDKSALICKAIRLLYEKEK